MDLNGKKVVLTGGAGFIGSHVADRLVEARAEVVVVDDLSVGRPENLADAARAGAKLVVGDIRDTALMARELQGAAVVIHMACDNLRASLQDPQRTHDVNATGSLTTALAAVQGSVERFVYVSSSEVYGSAVVQPMAEDHPLLPTTVYGASKAAGELYSRACMRRYGLPVIVVRPFNSYGPREHTAGHSAEVIPRFVARIRAGLPPIIFGDGTQTRDFTWVEETSAGIVAAAQCDALVGEAVNLAHGQPVSVAEICERLLTLLGANGLRPEFAAARPADVAHHWADTSKASRLIAWRPAVAIDEGLERYVRWVEAEGTQAERPGPEVSRSR